MKAQLDAKLPPTRLTKKERAFTRRIAKRDFGGNESRMIRAWIAEAKAKEDAAAADKKRSA